MDRDKERWIEIEREGEGTGRKGGRERGEYIVLKKRK